jgi:hypothetical protein
MEKTLERDQGTAALLLLQGHGLFFTIRLICFLNVIDFLVTLGMFVLDL